MNDQNKASKKKFSIVITLLLSLSLITLLLLPGCSCSEDASGEQEEIPNLVGMTKDDAERMITGYGFTLGKITEENSETVHEGLVISQSLVAGEMYDLETEIDIVVSKGSDAPPVEVKVPDLTGMTQTQAEAALFEIKLVPIPQDPIFKDGVAPGKIFTQSVAAGTSIAEGSQVAFAVALGSATVTVPQVTALSKDQATKALVDAGLNVDVHDEYNSSVAAGSVSSQNPYAKVQVVAGTTVVLMVSKGRLPAGEIETPNFLTLSLPLAVQTANKAGLLLNPAGNDFNGTVISQSPAPGVKIPSGSTVTLNFAAPVNPTDPDNLLVE